MFTIYYFNFYRFNKSGLLLDFFFKRIIFHILKFFLLINNIFFSEKYFVEYNFLQMNKWLSSVSQFVDYLNNEATFAALGVAVLSLLVALLFILMFEFTQYLNGKLRTYNFL